jgi:hypothetical protein
LAVSGALILAVFGLLVWSTAPDHVPQRDEAGFMELLFRAPVVLAAARVAIVMAAAYVALSVGWLVAAGQPLIKFGPAEAAPLLDEAGEEAERLRQQVESLTEERDRFLDDARTGWQVAHALADRLERPGPDEGIESTENGE